MLNIPVQGRYSPLTPLRAPPSGALVGTYQGGTVDNCARTVWHDRMLGYRCALGLGFMAGNSYTWDANAAAVIARVTNNFGGYVGLRSNVIVSTPLADNTNSLATTTAGTFDYYFTALGGALRDLGYPNAIIRLGWEANGNWYPWKAQGVEANYIAAFQRAVTLMRAVSGTSFKFFWNPDCCIGTFQLSSYANPPDFYPGDSFVDYIGPDAYNKWVNGANAPTVNSDGSGGAVAAGATPYPAPTAAVRWTNELIGLTGASVNNTVATGTTKPFGLAWFSTFAATHGKQIIVGEWGTGFDASRAGENCGDDGYYVTQMAAWIKANNVYAHTYWDAVTGGYNSRLSFDSGITGVDPATLGFTSQDNKPLSAAAFKSGFGA